MDVIRDMNASNYMLCREDLKSSDELLEESTWEDYYAKLETVQVIQKRKEEEFEKLKDKHGQR